MQRIKTKWNLLMLFTAVFVSAVWTSCKDEEASVDSVRLDKTLLAFVLGVDFTQTLTATVEPANAKDRVLSWSTDNENVATVANGVVTAVAEGTTIITVTAGNSKKMAKCVVKVFHPEVTGVTLDKTALPLFVGDSETLTPTVTPAEAKAKDVTWESSDETVATVDENGVVTGVAKGEAIITATTIDGGFTASCTVTVTPVAVIGVTLNKGSLTLQRLKSETLTATVVPENATNKTVTWESSDETVAIVSAAGLVRALKIGTTTITVTTNDGYFTETCEVTVIPSGSGPGMAALPDPVYFNNFERGLEGSTIVGSGQITNFGENFGKVFQNATGGLRTNYLLLPDDVLGHSGATKGLTISVWVNATHAGSSADYMWAPLFTAYGAPPSGSNTWPMMACQYRGVLQVNSDGWCDFVDAANDAGINTLCHGTTDWLADHEWHLYTAVFTETTAAVYLDGEIANSWTITGSGDNNSVGSLLGNNQLKYVCLGGNQAWNWGDNDPGFMFDDIAIYNHALTAEQVQTIIASKKIPSPVYFSNFETGLGETSIVGSGKLEVAGGNFGTVFQNATGGMRTNYLLLPEDVLGHSGTTKGLTISVWVNAAYAGSSGDYMWSPLFTAYGAPPSGSNTWPMMACQYRGVLQVNSDGWCDFVDAANDVGVNTLYHDATDWLADHGWHLYTVVFTETTAAVYLDGEVANSWTIAGSGDNNSVGSLLGSNQLKYVCLGGNQAWGWGDNDPGFMFDNVAIYNVALTEEQINILVQQKKE